MSEPFKPEGFPEDAPVETDAQRAGRVKAEVAALKAKLKAADAATPPGEPVRPLPKDPISDLLEKIEDAACNVDRRSLASCCIALDRVIRLATPSVEIPAAPQPPLSAVPASPPVDEREAMAVAIFKQKQLNENPSCDPYMLAAIKTTSDIAEPFRSQYLALADAARDARATLPPSAPQPVDAGRRCKITGNPCGTDTWAADRPCLCSECQAWLAASPTPSAAPVQATPAQPGDVAREAAEEIVELDAKLRGMDSPRQSRIDAVAAILQRHLPQGLSADERGLAPHEQLVVRNIRENPGMPLAEEALLDIIDRLTTPAAEDEKK